MYALQTQDGQYYTGRAGEGWVSADKAEAFTYGAAEAERRAAQFNRASALHGLTFSPVEA